MNKKKNEIAEIMYNKLMVIIQSYKNTRGGFKIKINANEKVVESISRKLHNEGIFFDKDTSIILLDEEAINRYKLLVGSVCSRRCSKKSKGKCIGCIEYDNTAKIASSFIQEIITL